MPKDLSLQMIFALALVDEILTLQKEEKDEERRRRALIEPVAFEDINKISYMTTLELKAFYYGLAISH